MAALFGTLEEAEAPGYGNDGSVHDDFVIYFTVMFILQIAYLMTILLVLY